jgi:hypothetical protein
VIERPAVDTLRFRKIQLKRAAKQAAYFKLILALICMQVSALLYVGFHHSLDQHDASGLVISPLESILSSFAETSQWWGEVAGGSDDEVDEEAASALADDDVMQLEDRMAENINKQLDIEDDEEKEKDDYERNLNGEDSSSGSSPLLQGDPLDNYYTRSHIRASRDQPPVPLVVGGSDGSGTRAFVDVLGRLGVPMLVDDPGTMDIHAAKSFRGQGWPPFALHALQAAEHHSSNYKISDLSPEAREQVEEELNKLKETFDRRSTRLRIRAQNRSTLLSTNVEYGFKAPITMLLLPMIQAYLYPQGFKYLHIVRDGRDVALSSNQSPVKKFYNATYTDAAERLKKFESMAPVYGMQLWSDWNADLFEWEQQAEAATASGKKSFDYIVMRTEDLLNPESKFEALTLLADFVGSQKTPHELCCQSRRAVVDMGQSAGNGGKRKAPPGLRTGFGNERRIKSSLMTEEYMNLKRKFMDDAANAAGKDKPSDMTPRERIDAMDKFRQERLKLMMAQGLVDENTKGSVTSDERHSKIEEIGNLVAARVGKRQRLTLEERNQRKEEFRVLLMERKRGKARGGDLADMIGRRRLFGEEDLLEKHQRAGHLRRGEMLIERLNARLDSVLGRTIPYSKHHPFGKDAMRQLPKPTMSAEDRHKFEYFEERVVEKNPAIKGRHDEWRERLMQRRNKRVGYAGDKALGTLLQSQLEKLKDDAEAAPKKGNVNDRYGKWSTLLQTAPELSQAMHKEGARALKLFGYEPPQRFMDRVSDDFVCDDTVICEQVIDEEQVKKNS